MKIIANDYNQGEIMKTIREWSGLTQKSFGKSIYRSEKSVQQYESNVRNCKLDTLLQIAKIHKLKITIEKEGE